MMYKLRTLLYRLSLKAVKQPPKQYIDYVIVLQERAKAPGFSTNQVPGKRGGAVEQADAIWAMFAPYYSKS